MKSYYFKDCKNIEEVKTLYKQLALKYHPDREGGSTEIMQEINAEYRSIIKNPRFNFSQQSQGCRMGLLHWCDDCIIFRYLPPFLSSALNGQPFDRKRNTGQYRRYRITLDQIGVNNYRHPA